MIPSFFCPQHGLVVGRIACKWCDFTPDSATPALVASGIYGRDSYARFFDSELAQTIQYDDL